MDKIRVSGGCQNEMGAALQHYSINRAFSSRSLHPPSEAALLNSPARMPTLLSSTQQDRRMSCLAAMEGGPM